MRCLFSVLVARAHSWFVFVFIEWIGYRRPVIDPPVVVTDIDRTIRAWAERERQKVKTALAYLDAHVDVFRRHE